MNWLDYVLIAILGLSALQSFRRGFSREIVSLIASVAALFLGMWFYPTAAHYLRPLVSSDRLASFLGFIAVVLTVLILGAIVGATIRHFVKAVGLSFFDRLLGALFGLLRGALIAMALLTAYIAFGPRDDSKTAPAGVVHSQIAPPLMAAASVVVDVAPTDLKRNFREMYAKVKAEIWNVAQTSVMDHPGGAPKKDSGKK